MASSRSEIGVKLRQMLRQGWLLWLIGFKEACCLHRVVILCCRSKRLLRRTGQCFLFNGFIFLGSVYILNSFVIPTLQWILPDHCPHIVYEEICRHGALSNLYLAMRKVLIQLFYYGMEMLLVTWMEADAGSLKGSTMSCAIVGPKVSAKCPLVSQITTLYSSLDVYAFGTKDLAKLNCTASVLVLSLIRIQHHTEHYLFFGSCTLYKFRYNDIAQQGFIAMGEHQPSSAHKTTEEKASSGQNAVLDKPAGLGGVMIGIGEQVYSALLLSFFFLEVFVMGFIPYVGQALNFLLLSWMYKWNLSGVPLDRRLDFFESNWAFFAGFGSPCVLAIFFFPPLKSYAVMATLFPLFVLAATGSHTDNLVSSPRKQWLGAGLERLPIFCVADALS
ncbi:hypothetical protein Cgig2_019677 [Carnegiea gigantea]|uniref:Uncharacterized protein n=1 Tax=Carnegiea gigantea TaxID=171969 RepID=A0A9Q1K158_9CARY|nr:hypothetical protein Cgig2_019677 [Carnegiea gigantea]